MIRIQQLLLSILLVPYILSAQYISGTVIDKDSRAVIQFANVYINNTSYGSTTDINGTFEMRYNHLENFTLVVSFIGYETVTKAITSKNRP
jgi:hypothetical protein